MPVLLQAAMGEISLGNLLPIIGVLSLIAILYKVYVEKSKRVIELLTTQKAILPLLLLLVLGLLPGSIIGLFGIASPVISVIVQVAGAVLVSFLIAGLITVIDQYLVGREIR